MIEWKGSYTSSHKYSTPPLLPAVELKSKQLPITINQAEQDKSNQISNEEEYTSPTHKELHSSSNDHVSSPHLSVHNSETSIKTEDGTGSKHDSVIEQPPAETAEGSVSLSPLSEDGDKTLLQQSSELLPEHLTSGDPVEEISEELENSEDNYSSDTMFEEESTLSPISMCLVLPAIKFLKPIVYTNLSHSEMLHFTSLRIFGLLKLFTVIKWLTKLTNIYYEGLKKF